MEKWFVEATAVSSLQAEICFFVQPNFYYGPDHPSDPEDLKKLVEPVSLPTISRAEPSMVTTAEGLGNEAQLASYYEQVVQLARKHQRPFDSIRHYFFLRFFLWNTEHKVHVSFPWYDSFSEIESFISCVTNSESGLIDHDQEQGWDLEVHCEQDTLYFRERDPDADETLLTISTPRGLLLAQLESLRKRTTTLIENLADALGEDVWTKYVRSEPFFRIKGP